MQSDWKVVTLEEVTSKLGDGLHGTPKYDDNGEYYFINGNNIGNGKINITPNTKKVSHEEFLKHRKDLTDRTIFVSINGTLGNVGLYNNEKICLGKSACYFNVKEGVSKEYIKYIMSSSIFQNYINIYATGTTIKNMGLKAMRSFSFNIPPLVTQKKIAHILSTLDEKIELNSKMNQTLESMAQALFKSWFVDFDPVHARATCKSEADLEAAATKLGISKEILELFPSEFVESEMGMIPLGWEAKELGTLTNITSSKRIFSKEYVDSGIPFYRSKEIINLSKGDSITDILYISEDRFSEIKEKFAVPKAQDILITSVGTIGRIYLVPDDSSFYFKDGNLTWINDYKNISPVFIYYFLKSASAQRQIDSVLIGSTQKALTIVNINRLSVMMASKDVLDEFTIQAESIFAKISKNTEQTRILEKTRDTLLPKLLSGEVKV